MTGSCEKMAPMRADRLLSVLLLLQSRGTVTAAEVAAEMEVSERTARRDLDALAMAGVPVYSQQGRNGGWRLVGGARTDLTGLTSEEARALFLVAGPASSATPQVKAALRKLVQALPEPFRPAAEAASAAVVVDPVGWGYTRPGGERPPPPFLDALQRAVVEGEQVRLDYLARSGDATSRVVHPLGLAAKRNVWYLVADTEAGSRTFRVDRVTAVAPTGEPVVRPPDFDLTQAWASVTAEVVARWSTVTARGLADPERLDVMRMVLGSRLRIGPPAEDGRVAVEVEGGHVFGLAAELAGWGAALEVLEPVEMRRHLADIGRQLVASYGVGTAAGQGRLRGRRGR
jgi:predicted DNA-binding transcriptional regulator YafY